MSTATQEHARKQGQRKGPTVSLRKRRVRGINSTIDHLHLRNQKWSTAVSNKLVREPTLVRTLEGASTLTLEVLDAEMELLGSPLLEAKHDVELDGLWFRSAGVSKAGENLSLTYEDREVAYMRRDEGAEKALRDRVTRAEFIYRLVKEVKPRIPVWIPELHQTQPIEDAEIGVEFEVTRDDKHSAGLGPDSNITVKGVRATPTQIRNIDQVLSVGLSLGANEKVLVSSIACIIQEATAQNLPGGDAPGYSGLFQQHVSWPGTATDIANAATNYFKNAPTASGGAIGYNKANPSASPAQIAQAVQRSAYPSAYAQWQREAESAVSQFLGGAGAGAFQGTATIDTEVPYQFERKKNEDTWACTQRLAQEVKWRAFVSAGIFYYADELRLLAQKPRIFIPRKKVEGVEQVDFDYDVGRPVTDLNITVRVREWAAPPGTVIQLGKKYGPAQGRYLVKEITSGLASSLATVLAVKATKPLPEPAPETESTSVSFGDSGGIGAFGGPSGGGAVARMAAEADRIDKLHLSYVWGGSHGQSPTPNNGPFDCSSYVSHILQHGGYDIPTMVSGALASWGAPGPGKDVTIYANSEHVLMSINGRFTGTSGSNPGGGPGWISTPSAGYLAGFTKRHPPNDGAPPIRTPSVGA